MIEVHLEDMGPDQGLWVSFLNPGICDLLKSQPNTATKWIRDYRKPPPTDSIDNKASCILGKHKLYQDWLRHHLGENGTIFYVPANFKVPMIGKIVHLNADDVFAKQENNRAHVIGFITGFENNVTTHPRSHGANLVTCFHEVEKQGSELNQDLWRRRFAKGATLAHYPLQYDFPARQSEEVVKLLQLVSGDIETNPGPMVSASSSNI